MESTIGHSNHASSQDELKSATSILTCQICFQNYDVSKPLQQPVTSQCGHCICEKCMCQLYSRKNSDQTVNCPFCKFPLTKSDWYFSNLLNDCIAIIHHDDEYLAKLSSLRESELKLSAILSSEGDVKNDEIKDTSMPPRSFQTLDQIRLKERDKLFNQAMDCLWKEITIAIQLPDGDGLMVKEKFILPSFLEESLTINNRIDTENAEDLNQDWVDYAQQAPPRHSYVGHTLPQQGRSHPLYLPVSMPVHVRSAIIRGNQQVQQQNQQQNFYNNEQCQNIFDSDKQIEIKWKSLWIEKEKVLQKLKDYGLNAMYFNSVNSQQLLWIPFHQGSKSSEIPRL